MCNYRGALAPSGNIRSRYFARWLQELEKVSKNVSADAFGARNAYPHADIAQNETSGEIGKIPGNQGNSCDKASSFNVQNTHTKFQLKISL